MESKSGEGRGGGCKRRAKVCFSVGTWWSGEDYLSKNGLGYRDEEGEKTQLFSNLPAGVNPGWAESSLDGKIHVILGASAI